MRALLQPQPVERRRQLGLERAELPDRPEALDALQLVSAKVIERRTGSSDEIPDVAGDEKLYRTGEGHHAGTEVNGDAAQPAVDLLALAEVDAGAHVEPEILHRGHDRGSTLQRGCVPGKVAKNPSPAVSCSRPARTLSSRLTTCRKRPSTTSQRPSPSSAASLVEPTMSRKRTAASRRRADEDDIVSV